MDKVKTTKAGLLHGNTKCRGCGKRQSAADPVKHSYITGDKIGRAHV